LDVKRRERAAVSSRLGRFRRGRGHLVVHVVVMVVVMMVMMVVMYHRSRRRSAGRSGFLREGIAGEAEREHGGSGESLDHGKIFLVVRGTPTVHRHTCRTKPELNMNRTGRAPISIAVDRSRRLVAG
jgi:hypothetical protein